MKNFIIISILLIISLSTVFAGGTSEPPEATEDEYRTVVDDRGVSVRIKKDVSAIATFPLPHPHIIAAIDGGVDRIIGASSMSVSAAKVSVFGKIHPELLDVETSYLNGHTLNVEELARIEPDVFFTDTVLEGMDNLEETGIPVVYLGLKKEALSYAGSDVEVYSPKVTMAN
ncbi:MAG: hypothetical protein JEZ04_22655, partial [Spirochaetales bacterium]|nr:hypothetical protein [Spirochaetales bacterium]